MFLHYYTAKSLSERFHADESHRSGIIDRRWSGTKVSTVSSVRLLLNINKMQTTDILPF